MIEKMMFLITRAFDIPGITESLKFKITDVDKVLTIELWLRINQLSWTHSWSQKIYLLHQFLLIRTITWSIALTHFRHSVRTIAEDLLDTRAQGTRGRMSGFLGRGRRFFSSCSTISFELDSFCSRSDGSVIARQGSAAILSTVVGNPIKGGTDLGLHVRIWNFHFMILIH